MRLLVSLALATLIFQRMQWSKPFCWICVRVPTHLSPLQHRRAPRINPGGTQGGAPCRDRALSQNGQQALCLSLNQLGSKARLMIVVNVASEKKESRSRPIWLSDRALCYILTVSAGQASERWQAHSKMTDRQTDKRLPGGGSRTYTWIGAGGEFRGMGNKFLLLCSIFNKLIRCRALHPEAILKWLSHTSVMPLIDRGRKGAREAVMMEGAGEQAGGGQGISQSWNNCVHKIPTVFSKTGRAAKGTQADKL